MKRFVKMLSIFVLCLFGLGGISFVSFDAFDTKQNQNIVEAATYSDLLDLLKDPKIYDNPFQIINMRGDIDLTNRDLSDWSSLETFYSTKRVFKGTFNGNGYSIKGLKLFSCENAYGLFPWTEKAIIKNLRIEGTTNFVIDKNNTSDVYVGAIVGHGENTTIANCEIECDFVSTVEGEETPLEYVDIYSNFNFGSVAGKIYQTSEPEVANILNVVNYNDVSLHISSVSRVLAGGIIGSLQGQIQNCINYGDLNISSSADSSANAQSIGGNVGFIEYNNSSVKNVCFAGNIGSENLNHLDLKKGAIIGSVSLSNVPKEGNINYNYWTSDLNAIGLGPAIASENMRKVDAINKDFLQDAENFDQIKSGFDFNKVFIMLSSRAHLQNFQTFKYSFSSTYDRSKVLNTDEVKIKRKYFDPSTEQEKIEEYTDVTSEMSFRYGDEITFVLTLKAENFGYYHLSDVLLGGNSTKNLTSIAKYDSNDKIIGYEITISVNDETSTRTKSSYAFLFEPNVYYCTVKVSDEAKDGDQGGVSVKESTSSGSATPSAKVDVEFKINSKAKTVKAEGKGIYNFSYWELYYEGSTTPVENFEFKDNSNFNIKYGEGVFNKPFTLIAYFDDADAIEVNFGAVDKTKIKDVILNGTVWADENIKVPKKIVPLEIVVFNKYKLNTDTFVSDFEKAYGEGSIIKSSDPITDEASGTTTYKFNLQLLNASIDDNFINIAINAEKDKSSNGQNLTWLWIVLSIVAVVGIGLAIFFIVRNKRGGGRRGGKSSKSSSKKAMYNYDDYYI